jgi:hypothetical protein
MSHPYIKVRGKTNLKRGGGIIPKIWTDGYHCCGLTGQVSISGDIQLVNKLYFIPEIKLTHAKQDVPIADGSVKVHNTALHFDFGLGYFF